MWDTSDRTASGSALIDDGLAHRLKHWRALSAAPPGRAQDRQQFSGPARRATVDLLGQLLSPTLTLPLTDAGYTEVTQSPEPGELLQPSR